MDKLLITLLFLTSCASFNKSGKKSLLTVELKDNLYANQDSFERIKLLGDVMFKDYPEQNCSKDWNKTVHGLKEKILRTKENVARALVWAQLGDCYVLTDEYKKSLYYYDLALSSELKDAKVTSRIYYNMGQIYERAGQLGIAISYYETSFELGDPTYLSPLKLALINHNLGEFALSNKWIGRLSKGYSQSELVRFIEGVNYFHMFRPNMIKGKVLGNLDEKSNSRALLNLALRMRNNVVVDDVKRDLSKLDLNFDLHLNFRNYLLNN